MPAAELPTVPYDATAVRPRWDELPPTLREAIGARLGARVTAARSAGAGFTRGFAAVLDTDDGDRVFVKAAPLAAALAGFYAREAAVTAALPAVVPAARPRWTLTTAEHFVLCLDAVDGRVPALPWAAADLDAALHAWAISAAALRDPPAELLAVGLPRLPDVLRGEFSVWAEIARGAQPLPSGPSWLGARIPQLTALERDLPGYAAGAAALHGDLRLDNVLLTADGARICDWTWPCLGAQWFDTVTLLVSAYGGDADVDALLAAHPTAAAVAPAAIDGALAALGGYWLSRAAAGPSDASPHSRDHQRFSGAQALRWLAARNGWLTRFGHLRHSC